MDTDIDMFGGRLKVSAFTTAGIRDGNQDFWSLLAVSSGTMMWNTSSGRSGCVSTDRPDMLLAAVFDGLGGMADGDLASRAAGEGLVGWARSEGLGDDPAGSLLRALRVIESRLTRDVPYGGTTVSAVIASEGEWTSIHVGDSRCYAVLPDGVWRTADQSPVEEMYRRGEITEERMNTHPRSNLMDWCLGNGGSRHAVSQPVPDGWSRLALCTDGAFGYMPPDDFRSLVRSADDAEAIVGTSIGRGSRDNSTVVAIDRTY